MSFEQPMGYGGQDIDITTGRPIVRKTLEERIQETELKERQAMAEAIQLANDLPTIMPIIATQLENRLYELMEGDPICKTIRQLASAFNLKLDIVPNTVRKIRRQIMGATLTSMTDETQVAPQGIPAGE